MIKKVTYKIEYKVGLNAWRLWCRADTEEDLEEHMAEFVKYLRASQRDQDIAIRTVRQEIESTITTISF